MEYRVHIQTVLWVIMTSCHSEKPLISEPLAVCEPYTGEPEVYGYCVYKNAHTLSDIESVKQYCSQVESWTEECKQAWVMSQKDRSLTELLQVCGSNSECSFELLDSKPQDDVMEQMRLCIDHAGHFGRDCVMHAIQHWYFTWPTAEDIRMVAIQESDYPDLIGMYVAARVACDGVGACEGEAEVQLECEKFLNTFRNQNNCPNQHRNRVWKGRRRTDGSKFK